MGNMEVETPVPGTGETPAVQPEPSAGTQNADTTQAGPPETVPYSRFKEVNDRYSELRDYEQFQQYGYDPDSLGRLVQFEVEYMQDPIGTTANMIETLDLPEDRKAAVKLLLQNGDVEHPAVAQGNESENGQLPDQPPAWAQPLIEDFVGRRQASEQSAIDQTLEKIVDHWDTLDKKDNLTSPSREFKLAMIAANATRGTTPEQIAEIARDMALGYREHVLGGAVSEVRTPTGSPLPVPGSGVSATPPVKVKTLTDASALARAALESGQLQR